MVRTLSQSLQSRDQSKILGHIVGAIVTDVVLTLNYDFPAVVVVQDVTTTSLTRIRNARTVKLERSSTEIDHRVRDSYFYYITQMTSRENFWL